MTFPATVELEEEETETVTEDTTREADEEEVVTAMIPATIGAMTIATKEEEEVTTEVMSIPAPEDIAAMIKRLTDSR